MGRPPGKSRIAALDGWRGIAILLVIADHLQLLGFHAAKPLATGQHGVTAFFVLSGFLITGKLMEPGQGLGRFYLRRMFRLMPAAWLFLLLMWTWGFLPRNGHTIPMDLTVCALFIRNYFDNLGPGTTMHFWSLSIEEQFYFVWPAVLLWTGNKRAKWVALAGAILSWAWYRTHTEYYQLFRMFQTEVRADALLVGCFIALALEEEADRPQFVRWARWASWPAAIYLIWVCLGPRQVPSLLECGAWGLVIACSAYTNLGVLSWRPLVWLGQVSYSLYIWNVFVIVAWNSFPHSPVARVAFLMFPVASYYLVERPGVRIGNRLSRAGGTSLRFRSALHHLFERHKLLDDAAREAEAGGQ